MSDTGIDKIISHIEAQVEKEVSEILGKARAEADTIKKNAQEQAKIKNDKILLDGKRKASLEEQRIIAETKVSVRREMMNAQEEAIVASFNDATKTLEELAEKGKVGKHDYKDIMYSLISSASQITAGNKLELLFNQRDAKTFNEKILDNFKKAIKKETGKNVSLVIAKETIQSIGGVVVRDLEKSVEVNNTLEAKLERLKETMRVDVARILFGDMT